MRCHSTYTRFWDEEAGSFLAYVKDAYTRRDRHPCWHERGGGACGEGRTGLFVALSTATGAPSLVSSSCWVEKGETNERIGRVWLGKREAGQPVGVLYDIEIGSAFRGRGLGRQLMLLIEEEARRRGFTEIRLNVFGGNEIARSLYRSLGYAEFAIAMRKRLP